MLCFVVLYITNHLLSLSVLAERANGIFKDVPRILHAGESNQMTTQRTATMMKLHACLQARILTLRCIGS